MAAPKEYEKLPGRGARFEGTRLVAGRRISCSLWLGGDHLLLIQNTGYTQEFKRFYYRDIQALIVRRTQHAKIWTAIFATLAGFCVLIGIAIDDSVGRGIFEAIAGVFVALLITNLVRGPSCATHLKTAVQTEILPSLGRLRTAEKAIIRIKERLLHQQGVLETETAQTQARTALEAAMSRPAAAQAIYHATSGGEQIRPYRSRMHFYLFVLLFVDGLLSLGSAFWHGIAVVFVGTLISIATTATTIACLLKQHQTDLAAGVRRVTTVTMCYLAANIMASYVQFMALANGDPHAANNEWEMLQRYAALSPQEHPWLFYMSLTCAMISVGLGTLGLYLLQRFESRRRVAEAASATIAPPSQQPPAAAAPSLPVEPPPPVS